MPMQEPNGHVASPKGLRHMNGKANMNGHAVSKRRAVVAGGPSLLARSFSVIARLFTWYSIITILFRCPSTLEACDETYPRICKPYFQIKSGVEPHIEPYYRTYAAPYVDIAKPYYNVVDQNVFVPAKGYAVKYAAPMAAQAQRYAKSQWGKNVYPQVEKYRDLAKARYGEVVAPHVDQVYVAVNPYLDIARTNALQTYHEILMPTYQFVEPYAMYTYSAASAFTMQTAVPSATWALKQANSFLDGTVWPHIRVLYTQNVEPQLVRIGERLGRHKGQPSKVKTNSTPKAVPSSTDTKSSFKKPSSSAKPVIASPSTSSEEGVAHSSSGYVSSSSVESPSGSGYISAPPPSQSETDLRRIARETVAEDLQSWQEKFAKAADEGATEIEDRIDNLAYSWANGEAMGQGKQMVDDLRDAVKTEMQNLRRDIITIVQTSGDDSAMAQEDVVTAVRRAGMAIKQKAEDVRTWRENFETDLQAAVTQSADDHWKILVSIKDLALQKIGMKWAWMDGITYKDWAKYHELKDKFVEWMNDLKALIVTHPGILSTQDAATAVEDSAMEVARAAVQELGRLKEVAGWKLAAGDDTENFESEAMRLAAEAASKAATSAKQAPSSASSISSKASKSVSSAVEAVSSSAADSATSILSRASTSSSMASAATSSGVSKASEITDTILKSPSSMLSEAAESLASVSDATGKIIPKFANNITRDQADPEDVEEMDDIPVKEPEAGTVKPALFGAAAQAVPNLEPIMDDDEDIAARISSMANSAYSNAASRASDQYSAAMSIVSAQFYGEPKPVHEQMLSSVSSAYTAAMASASSRLDQALYAAMAVASSAKGGMEGTKTGWAIPTPTIPEWSHIEDIAAQRLREGQQWAAEQYESAKIALGMATPTPTSQVEKLLAQAKFNYYAGLGVAHARYSEFLAAASSAISSMTATPTPTDLRGSASSVASVASGSASSVVSVASESASSMASVVGDTVSSAAQAVGDSVYSAASVVNDSASSAAAAAGEHIVAARHSVVSAAQAAGENVSGGWDVIVSKISINVYGPPTPSLWYESLFSAAMETADSASSAVADGAASVTQAAGTYGAAAASQASAQYSAISSLVSELIVGKEPTFSESVLSRLNAAYSTGLASAASIASVASASVASVAQAGSDAAENARNNVASVASEATEAVKETIRNVRDEL